MGKSNRRNKEYETYHHLTSRIAHRVFFLNEEERNDFVERMRRVADFVGVELVGWCIMSNHFHIFVYLPLPCDPDEAEVLRRIGVLKGRAGLSRLEDRIAAWRRMNGGELLVECELKRIKARMYSIRWFMKILKQWSTEDYNRRSGHTGTLWESVYGDSVVPDRVRDKSTVLGYIHLNPIRAAASVGFDDYPWSSFTAFRRGDALASRGMRLVYGEDMSSDEMYATHVLRMDEALSEMKRTWALEVARRRAAGYEVPHDPLTDEALVAQEARHLSEVQHDGTVLDEERRGRGRPRMDDVADKILEVLSMEPGLSVVAIAGRVGASVGTVSSALSAMKRSGMISRTRRGEPWCVNFKKSP